MLSGTVAGPVVGLFTLGAFIPWANTKVRNQSLPLITSSKKNCFVVLLSSSLAFHSCFIKLVSLVLKGAVSGQICATLFGVWVGIGGFVYPKSIEKQGFLPLEYKGCSGNLTFPSFTPPSDG